jgi:3-oxoacyl-[acyl-carrier-protein] synthase-1
VKTRVCIAATGTRTPVGLHSASAAAAVRAGITRLAEHPFMIDQAGDPMPAAMDPRLDPALFGAPRFVELAKSALEEVTASLLWAASAAMPLYLGLPEIRPGFSKEDVFAIRSSLPYSDVNVILEGHAAGLAALQLATEKIESGELEAGLVGGVESYFHPDTMEWLDSNRQLTGSVSRCGFVPGEGAAVCLLLSEKAAYRRGLRPLAWVAAAATGRETKLIKTSDVCLGEGLTAVVKEATRGLEIPRESVTDIICDMNSERYRSEEWGFVCLRLPFQMANPTDYVSPADCWGDMGSASGPLFAMLACQAWARNYAKGPRTLLWASSEGGLRGAVLLESSHVN